MKRLIVQRQSPDWSKVHSIDDSVTFLENRLFDPATDDGRQKLEYTRRLLQFWEQCTGTPFWSVRQQLKDLAHASWKQVHAVDEIVLHADFDATVGEQFAANDRILFVDDDDWIAPDAFERLDDLASRTKYGVIWGRARFDGLWQWLEIHGGPITVYTNNYLVLAGSIADLRLADAMQHSTLQAMYAAGTWQPLELSDCGLTVTNKSPCSWNYLHQPMQSSHPVEEFNRRLDQYAHARFDRDDRVAWAHPLATASQQVFQTIAAARPKP